MIDLQLGHLLSAFKCLKEIKMYGIPSINETGYHKRVRSARPIPKLKPANKKGATFTNVRLSRIGRGLLALDRLIRRIGKRAMAAAG